MQQILITVTAVVDASDLLTEEEAKGWAYYLGLKAETAIQKSYRGDGPMSRLSAHCKLRSTNMKIKYERTNRT